MRTISFPKVSVICVPSPLFIAALLLALTMLEALPATAANSSGEYLYENSVIILSPRRK